MKKAHAEYEKLRMQQLAEPTEVEKHFIEAEKDNQRAALFEASEEISVSIHGASFASLSVEANGSESGIFSVDL